MMNVEDDSKPWGAEWREGRNFRRVADLLPSAIYGLCQSLEMKR